MSLEVADGEGLGLGLRFMSARSHGSERKFRVQVQDLGLLLVFLFLLLLLLPLLLLLLLRGTVLVLLLLLPLQEHNVGMKRAHGMNKSSVIFFRQPGGCRPWLRPWVHSRTLGFRALELGFKSFELLEVHNRVLGL